MSRTEQLQDEGAMDFTRQLDWFDPSQHPDAKVTVVGCGGIGSPTALCLAKLGIPYLTLMDFDEVEPHNVPNQFYAMASTGLAKVQALGEMCEAFGSSEITMIKDYAEDHPEEFGQVVVTGLDTMAARKAVWSVVKDNTNVELLIDARLGGQDINITSFNPNDVNMQEYYESEMLFDDSEAIPAPCTARGIIDVSFQVASLITRQVRRYLADEPIESFITLNQAALGLGVDVSEGGKRRTEVLAALDKVKA